MRKAFNPETGRLTDKSVVTSEREATAALFAGAIGAAKNPSSHREFEMSKAEAALDPVRQPPAINHRSASCRLSVTSRHRVVEALRRGLRTTIRSTRAKRWMRG